MQTPKRKRYQKDSAPADDILTLIQLVRQNPALYNYKLQPNQRRRIDVLNGWAHIAAQIGNKYTVEECRRKWKNLRDTYHQYRLRKPKLGDGLAKWRYTKELEFLTSVYQPKLKSHRQPNFDVNSVQTDNLLQSVVVNEAASAHDDMVHSSILVDDAETFILTTYEESVNDDVHHHHHHHHHQDPSMSHMELTHHSHHAHDEIVDHEDDNDEVEDVVDIVKNEHIANSSMDGIDDDDATGAEVDYEEVCLYEEAGNVPSVDCETVGTVVRTSSTDSKTFQYIDTADDFCIGQLPKLKNVTVVSNASVAAAAAAITTSSSTITTTAVDSVVTVPNILQFPQSAPMSDFQQSREELDLFFDFLKKKMQRFSKAEITAMQVEFLNCVLRREADSDSLENRTSGRTD